MKSFFAQQEIQDQAHRHNHPPETFAMVKHLIQTLIRVIMVVYVAKMKEHVVQILMHVTKNPCTNVSMDIFNQNK